MASLEYDEIVDTCEMITESERNIKQRITAFTFTEPRVLGSQGSQDRAIRIVRNIDSQHELDRKEAFKTAIKDFKQQINVPKASFVALTNTHAALGDLIEAASTLQARVVDRLGSAAMDVMECTNAICALRGRLEAEGVVDEAAAAADEAARAAAVRNEEAAAHMRAEMDANAAKSARIAELEARLAAEAEAKAELEAQLAAEAEAKAEAEAQLAAEVEAKAEAEAKLAEGFMPKTRKALGSLANNFKDRLLN